MRKLWILLGTLVTPLFALQTQYISFEHPEKWVCENAQGTYICQSTDSTEKREALIMSIATYASEWDSLDNYLEHLKKPKKIKDDRGVELISTVSYAHRRKINGVEWIDSLQHNSELPGFWTRYLATVQNKLAILVTYVVSEEYYKRLAPRFDRMVASLKPNAEFDVNAAQKSEQISKPGTEKLGREFLEARLNVRRAGGDSPKKPAPVPSGSTSKLNMTLLVFVFAGLGFYFARKRRQRRSPPSE